MSPVLAGALAGFMFIIGIVIGVVGTFAFVGSIVLPRR